ncbi:MAG: hypothetical protein CMK74_01005 [Pseudomonadales bacterium]|nr:hypothetical protein [Pseudomonadales bacterium]
MALAPIILADEEPVRLIAPSDDAIDIEATGEDRYMSYALGEDLDIDQLVMRAGVEPTVFTVRAISAREKRIIEPLMPGEVPEYEGGCTHVDCEAVHAAIVERGREKGKKPPERAGCHRARQAVLIEVATQYLRFGLVSVENMPWPYVRQRMLGRPAWSAEVISAIPMEALRFLGTAVLSLSGVGQKKSERSGSSPEAPSGTTPGSKASGSNGSTAQTPATASP